MACLTALIPSVPFQGIEMLLTSDKTKIVHFLILCPRWNRLIGHITLGLGWLCSSSDVEDRDCDLD